TSWSRPAPSPEPAPWRCSPPWTSPSAASPATGSKYGSASTLCAPVLMERAATPCPPTSSSSPTSSPAGCSTSPGNPPRPRPEHSCPTRSSAAAQPTRPGSRSSQPTPVTHRSSQIPPLSTIHQETTPPQEIVILSDAKDLLLAYSPVS